MDKLEYKKINQKRSDSNLHTEVLQNQTPIQSPEQQQKQRLEGRPEFKKQKGKKGLTLQRTLHVSRLLAHPARNKQHYVECLQVPHCNTETSNLDTQGQDDLSKGFSQAASWKWLLPFL